MYKLFYLNSHFVIQFVTQFGSKDTAEGQFNDSSGLVLSQSELSLGYDLKSRIEMSTFDKEPAGYLNISYHKAGASPAELSQ